MIKVESQLAINSDDNKNNTGISSDLKNGH